MKLAWFGVEEWLNPMDSLARINLGSSCVSALRMDELFDLTGGSGRFPERNAYHEPALSPATPPAPRIKAAVAGIYPKGNVKPEEVMITHGGTGANDLVLMSVLEPGDNCVVIKPSYQQHYDIPKGSGIETRVVQLKAEDNYQLDFDALDKACDANTKMIVLTNPNNPIGVTLYDEACVRSWTSPPSTTPGSSATRSIAGWTRTICPPFWTTATTKAISISSMSKMYSMAGTRIGWIVCRDHEMYEVMKTRRSYNTICCGIWDEIIASIALEHYQALWARPVPFWSPTARSWRTGCLPAPYSAPACQGHGPTCLIDYDYDVDSETLAKDAMATSRSWWSRRLLDMPKTIRVGYGAFRDPQVLKAGLEEFGKYLEKYN